jgi:hypothetical protein
MGARVYDFSRGIHCGTSDARGSCPQGKLSRAQGGPPGAVLSAEESACDRLQQGRAELLPDGRLICAFENFDCEDRRAAIAADVGA